MSNDDDDDDQYIDLSDDEDDLSDLYPGKFYFNGCKTCSNKVFRFKISDVCILVIQEQEQRPNHQ